MSYMLQGNPSNFDIRSYIQQPMIYWNVNRYLDQISIADHVFIWESGSSGGVLAYGIISEPVVQRKMVQYPNLIGAQLWQNQVPDDVSLVIGIQLIKTIHTGYYISRENAKSDPELAGLDVLRMPQGTVYKCTPMQVVRMLQGD